MEDKKMIAGTELTKGQRRGLGIFIIIVFIIAIAFATTCGLILNAVMS